MSALEMIIMGALILCAALWLLGVVAATVIAQSIAAKEGKFVRWPFLFLIPNGVEVTDSEKQKHRRFLFLAFYSAAAAGILYLIERAISK